MAKKWDNRPSEEREGRKFNRSTKRKSAKKPKTKADLILDNQNDMMGTLEMVRIQGEDNMFQLDELTAKVAGVEGVVESAKVAFDGILAELAAVKGGMSDPADQAKISDLSARLSAAVDKLAAAIAVNPRVSPPVVEPPVGQHVPLDPVITQEELAAENKRAADAKAAADQAVVDAKAAEDAAAAQVLADAEAAAKAAQEEADNSVEAEAAAKAEADAAAAAEQKAFEDGEAMAKKADEDPFVS